MNTSQPKDRKPGFYWVKPNPDDIWMPGHWAITLKAGDEMCWTLTGDEIEYQDSDFTEINETPIPPPEK